MSIKVDIDANELVVSFTGWDRIWTFHRRACMPLAHITAAHVGDRDQELRTTRLRLVGSYIPKTVATGLFTMRGGGRQLWAVYRRTDVLVIDLIDEEWKRLVLQVEDPAALAAGIEAARPGRLR
jgi:hypothetical protein